jgi:hypothetical protein
MFSPQSGAVEQVATPQPAARLLAINQCGVVVVVVVG